MPRLNNRPGFVFATGITVLMLGAVSCETVLPIPPPPVVIEEEDSRILIVDRTGKEWDITTAVQKYGLKADRFNFGLGPDAIPPLYSPLMLGPEDKGYPGDTDFFRVIGGNVNGDTRAYATRDLDAHEVVNEVIGGEDVFVGW